MSDTSTLWEKIKFRVFGIPSTMDQRRELVKRVANTYTVFPEFGKPQVIDGIVNRVAKSSLTGNIDQEVFADTLTTSAAVAKAAKDPIEQEKILDGWEARFNARQAATAQTQFQK